jgi:hypothetical protein
MPRQPARIQESDIRRAVRAYGTAGLHVRVIYNRDGSTVIEPVAGPAPSLAIREDENEWDSVGAEAQKS